MLTQNLAAIDIGTNSFHLIIVRPDEEGNFEIIGREREVIRLSEGNTNDIKILNPSAIERGIRALSTFKGIANTYNAQIRAVATSAVREAENREDFIQRVLIETGININVVSGFEEARLIYLGILKAVPLFNERILCIDIGGGSTEFVVGEKGDIIYSNSLKLGAVRLTQKFFPDGKVTKERIADCSRWVEGEIYPVIKSVEHLNYKHVVGSSGTIQACSSICIGLKSGRAAEPSIINNQVFSLKELIVVKEKILSGKTTESRKKIPGLESKRADIIPAGVIILSTILGKLGTDKITVSGYALREGIIIDSMYKSLGGSFTDYLHNIRAKSIEQLAQSSEYDRNHCKHVADLALQLFDKLKQLHNLNGEYKEYLFAASLLHDIGYHISHDKHHRHSFYIIRHSKLLGFTDPEILLIANIARYHRKSHPKKRHDDFTIQNEVFQNVTKKLSAILRVADALDRTHSGNVKNIETHVSDKSVKLYIDSGKQPIDIELWSLERRKELFEELFGKKLRVELI